MRDNDLSVNDVNDVIEMGEIREKLANPDVPNYELEESKEKSIPETEDMDNRHSNTQNTRWLARFQLFAACFTLFLAGWDSGTPGPLIPRLQEFYHVNYLVVSMIFVLNSIGFLVGAILNIWLSQKLAFGKTLILGSLLQLLSYVIMSPALPFPVFCIAFLIDGIGIALQDSQSNSYVANLKENPSVKMGLLHATYGFGALASPLVSTQFAQMRHWSFHYLTAAAIAILNTVLLYFAFRGRSIDECLKAIGQDAGEKGSSENNHYKQILGQKVLHLLAFFSLVYVGVEFAVGGWTVTYIINERHGGPSSGYISTGFFAGLAVGRLLLLPVNHFIGEHLVIFPYIIFSLGLQFVIWFVPSLVGDAIAIALQGFLFGPIYPILMNQSARLIQPWLLTGSIGWIGGFGFTGAAFFPFVTGALASHFGIKSMQPFLVVLLGILLVLWALVPNSKRKAD